MRVISLLALCVLGILLGNAIAAPRAKPSARPCKPCGTATAHPAPCVPTGSNASIAIEGRTATASVSLHCEIGGDMACLVRTRLLIVQPGGQVYGTYTNSVMIPCGYDESFNHVVAGAYDPTRKGTWRYTFTGVNADTQTEIFRTTLYWLVL